MLLVLYGDMAKYNLTKKTQLPIAECYRCHCPIYIGDMYYGKRAPYEICLDCFDKNTDSL